jgi:hypothetical protein
MQGDAVDMTEEQMEAWRRERSRAADPLEAMKRQKQ